MKSRSKNHFLLLISGWVVFLVPVIFVNFLLNTSFVRYRNSTEALLREKLLITSEKINHAFTPEGFVKSVIQDAHKDVMPEVVPEIINMTPSESFGKSEFSADTPTKFKTALASRDIMPLAVNIYGLQMRETFYWLADSLSRQIPDKDELENLLLAFNFKALQMFEFLYPQLYQKPPPTIAISLKNLFLLLKYDHITYPYKYISRFSTFFFNHEKLDTVFTDYFGHQMLYIYSYCCLSEAGMHGAYSIIVPQTSLKSEKIITKAKKIANSESARLQLIAGKDNSSSFAQEKKGMSYIFAPPTKFLNHLYFEKKIHPALNVLDNFENGLALKALMDWPKEFTDTEKQINLAKKASWTAFALAVALSLLLMHFKLPFALSIKGKLAAILCIIFLIPFAGTVSMVVRMGMDADRLLEMRIQDYTANSLELARSYDDENRQRAMLSSHKIRMAIEKFHNGKISTLISQLATEDGLDNWFQTWTSSILLCDSHGKFQSFDNFGKLFLAPSSLLVSMLSQFSRNLGLIKSSGKLQLNADTLKMGFMENYLTPEMQEKSIPHEGTIQQEIINAADTMLNTFLICMNDKKQAFAVITRLNINNQKSNAYLSEFINPRYQFFRNRDKYSKVELAAKMRKSVVFDKEAWVNRGENFTKLDLSFSKALANRDSGYNITRNLDAIECNGWNFQREAPIIFAANSQGSTKILEHSSISLWFIALSAYLIVLLFVINQYFCKIITGPMKIFHEGIEALKNDHYGITIKSFSQDEFNSVTEAFNAMSLALKQKEMIKRYIPEKLIEEVESEKDSGAAFTQTELSFLTSDIRGFTTLSERYNPSEIVDMLNSYFTVMELAIKKHNGTINKYIGDAIEAVFISESPQCSAINACKAAKEMRKSLAILNLERMKSGLFTIENGIGIASGTAGYGTTGSQSGRKDYAIIGAITEKANYLEAMTKNISSKILICSATSVFAGHRISTRRFKEESQELLID